MTLEEVKDSINSLGTVELMLNSIINNINPRTLQRGGISCEDLYDARDKVSYTINTIRESLNAVANDNLDADVLMKKAADIVKDQKHDDDRQYPPFQDSMERVAIASSAILRTQLSASDLCIIMTLLKLDREAYQHKEDNILDGLAYLGMITKFYQ